MVPRLTVTAIDFVASGCVKKGPRMFAYRLTCRSGRVGYGSPCFRSRPSRAGWPASC